MNQSASPSTRRWFRLLAFTTFTTFTTVAISATAPAQEKPFRLMAFGNSFYENSVLIHHYGPHPLLKDNMRDSVWHNQKSWGEKRDVSDFAASSFTIGGIVKDRFGNWWACSFQCEGSQDQPCLRSGVPYIAPCELTMENGVPRIRLADKLPDYVEKALQKKLTT